MSSRIQTELNVYGTTQIPTWFYAEILYEIMHQIMRDTFALEPTQYTITCTGLDDEGAFN